MSDPNRAQGIVRPIAISPLRECVKIFQETDSNHRPTPGTVSSRDLKFGVDRILSEDISPPEATRHPDMAVTTVTTPCSECVTSLLRCCRLSSSSADHHRNGLFTHYTSYSTIHTPRPLRPYTNLLMPDGSSERNISTASGPITPTVGKRKRSWSRAVFSNLQRKGLEKRFQLQKYITKPDRRQLAATLGLTDAQVKVWFQNRRMKWRHSKEGKHQVHHSKDDQGRPDSTQESEVDGQHINS